MASKKQAEGEHKEPKKKGRADVKEYKQKLVRETAQLIDKYPIVGILNMKNLPAKQLANMRSQLRGKVVLIMTKKRILKIALEHSKKENIMILEPHLKGMPALLLTEQNPFSLFKLLKKNRSKAAIKGGQTAPSDITVHAGATNFAPGPVIGELGGFKIKAGIEGGKVVIKEDKVVAYEGDIVNDKLAGLLTRLGIEPMEIGLSLTVVFEKGEILTSKVLDIDEDAFKASLHTAATETFNLAVFAAIANADTVKTLLSKAHREAYALAKEAKITTSETIKEQLAQVEAEMLSLKKAAKL
ncbi:MAG: 50S ribosomal protein L10 [archaeon]